MHIQRVVSGVIGAAVFIAGVSAQKPEPTPSTSAGPARELMQLMTSAKDDAFAVRDPGADGRYIAVMNVAGVELLVVAAKADPAALEYRLFQKDYKGAYADIDEGLNAKNKVLVEDFRGDGLVAVPAKGAKQFDRVTSDGKDFVFDGDLKAKKMTADEYQQRFVAADAAYAHDLATLVAELKKIHPQPGRGLSPARGLR